jgi:predicted nicotinamide N-methyase
VDDEYVVTPVRLRRSDLRIRQPAESASLPDDGGVEWAPLAPYWSVLWRSGVALARELDGARLAGKRIVELGCGLGLPSLAAARAGARVLATDSDPEAVALVEANARDNGIGLEAMAVDWRVADALVARRPFDLILAADVLYERPHVDSLLDLLPRLGRKACIADPGREHAGPFLGRARRRWAIDTQRRGIVSLHWLTMRKS